MLKVSRAPTDTRGAGRGRSRFGRETRLRETAAERWFDLLGGVITLLAELGRDLDLALTKGSIDRARDASRDVGTREEIRIVIEGALDDGALPEPS